MDDHVTFELTLPGENSSFATRFTLDSVASGAFFSLDNFSDDFNPEKTVNSLRKCLESSTVCLVRSNEMGASRTERLSFTKEETETISDAAALSIKCLVKSWLEAYESAEQHSLPAAPPPAMLREQSDSTFAASLKRLELPSRPWLTSRASTISSSSESTTTTLNAPSTPSVMLHLRLDEELANVRLLSQSDMCTVLDEVLLSRLASSKWEVRRLDSDLEKPATAVVAIDSIDSISAEKAKLSKGCLHEHVIQKKKSAWWKLFGPPDWVEKPPIVVAADGTAIVLPTPPSDEEKFLYTQTRRVPLYLFGTLSFLAVSVGMWFFVITSPKSYWFGILVGFIEIYLIVSFVVGYFGKDFDFKGHLNLLESTPITADAPSVDIYLPCCGEPLEVLENTYKHVSKLNYPNFKVYVLDDGGLDTVKRLAEQYGFTYFCRDNRPYLKKAGNLRWAFPRTSGDFFVIYDADFCPRHDFLRDTIAYMINDPNIAILQTPQFFRPCNEQTWVEQGASATQELFYRIVQVNRDRWGASICVGSNAVYRRSALEPVGGTAEIGHSEDVHTGFYAITRGWRLKYIPVALACGISPDTPKAYFSQQMRWCAGSTQLLSNPDFWKSKLTWVQKVCFLSGMFYYSACGVMIFIIPLPGLFMVWVSPEKVFYWNCFWAVPSLLYTLLVFRLWSRQRYNINVQFVFVIQSYAFLMAVKDRIFNTTASWVPSGNVNGGASGEKTQKIKKSSAATKYRNMRILCFVWQFSTCGAVIAGFILRVLQGHHFYNFIPILVFDIWNFVVSLRFIFCSS